MPRARWLPLIVDGGWNPSLRDTFSDASGAYAIREKRSGRVLYVGESHTGRGWKTLTRHFQDASGKFASRNGDHPTFVHSRPGELDGALWVTSRGPRKQEDGDERAMKLQAELIARFKKQGYKLRNVDDGMAADDFAFGANVKKNPGAAPRLVVLGELVSLVYKDAGGRRRVLRFGVRGAPIVAYGATLGRLVLVFAPHVVGRSSAAGAKEYKRTHWGKAGDGQRLEGDILAGKASRLGTATELTYATRKGVDSAPVNYWHTFGDFGALARKRSFIPPDVHGAMVGGRQLLRLSGGTYTVSAHGIVG